MEKRLDTILIPSSYKKVNLPRNNPSKRKILAQYDGQLVLINDSHNCQKGHYKLVKLRIDPQEQETYYAQSILNQSGDTFETRMHLHDLEGLLVPYSGVSFKHDFK